MSRASLCPELEGVSEHKKYGKTKETNIDWLGDVPYEWDLRKVKYMFSIRKRIAGELGLNVLSITQRGIVVKDVESGEGQLSMDYSKYQRVYPGDFAMNHMDLLTGYVDISPFEGVTSPDYRVFTLERKGFSAKYYLYIFQLGYQLRIFYYLGQGASHLGRWRLATDEFNEMIFPVPSPLEQEKIVSFLDYEISKIDELLASQQQLIHLLKEKLESIISQVVTKGLEDNVKVYDSGVEWLGEIPAHWILTKIKYIADLNPKIAVDVKDLPNECSFVPMDKLKTDRLSLDEFRRTSEVISGYTPFFNDDVLMAKVTPCFENKNIAIASGLINGIGFGSTEIYVLRCKNALNNRFLFYRLQEEQFVNVAISSMTGAGGLKRVPTDIVNNFKMALPPYHEQLEISAYLDNIKAMYAEIITEVVSQVSLLKERRLALIYAAVTGKIDVRHWQPDAKDVA